VGTILDAFRVSLTVNHHHLIMKEHNCATERYYGAEVRLQHTLETMGWGLMRASHKLTGLGCS
jgi:hypothetical protein